MSNQEIENQNQQKFKTSFKKIQSSIDVNKMNEQSDINPQFDEDSFESDNSNINKSNINNEKKKNIKNQNNSNFNIKTSFKNNNQNHNIYNNNHQNNNINNNNKRKPSYEEMNHQINNLKTEELISFGNDEENSKSNPNLKNHNKQFSFKNNVLKKDRNINKNKNNQNVNIKQQSFEKKKSDFKEKLSINNNVKEIVETKHRGEDVFKLVFDKGEVLVSMNDKSPNFSNLSMIGSLTNNVIRTFGQFWIPKNLQLHVTNIDMMKDSSTLSHGENTTIYSLNGCVFSFVWGEYDRIYRYEVYSKHDDIAFCNNRCYIYKKDVQDAFTVVTESSFFKDEKLFIYNGHYQDMIFHVPLSIKGIWLVSGSKTNPIKVCIEPNSNCSYELCYTIDSNMDMSNVYNKNKYPYGLEFKKVDDYVITDINHKFKDESLSGLAVIPDYLAISVDSSSYDRLNSRFTDDSKKD
jgi:hypothetical protein